MTDSFGFESNIEQELDLEQNPTARVEELKRRVEAENTFSKTLEQKLNSNENIKQKEKIFS